MSVKNIVLAAAGAGGSGPPPPPPPPPFSTIGCIVYYDPGYAGSYSGTGSTIHDLSGNGWDGTIYNATFDGATAGGVFNFSAAAGNNYIITPNLYIMLTSAALTIEVWTRATAAGVPIMEVGQPNILVGGYRANLIEYGNTGPFYAPRAGYIDTLDNPIYNAPSTSGSLNTWTQFVAVFGAAAGPVVYRNGANKSTVLNTGVRKQWWNQAPTQPNQQGNYWAAAFGAGSSQNWLNLTSNMYNGAMGAMRLYDRALTDAEVLYNYNGLKSRYGLP